MTREGHLQTFQLTLETKTPLFIGCGKSYSKKEYLFDRNRGIVSFIDEHKFFLYLIQHNLVDFYQDFILGNTENGSLYSFLRDCCGISESDIARFVRCRVNTVGALNSSQALKEIQCFIRGADGQVYVPGSSIKGAIRTVLLKSMVMASPPEHPNPQMLYGISDHFEDDYFHTLSLKKEGSGAVVDTRSPLNSIMQGIRISDSLPISDNRICITRKRFICRECIAPNTKIFCTITLDQSILRGTISIDRIRQAIADASTHYQGSVPQRHSREQNYMNSKTILLGGGAGFQSKTVTDPYFGDESHNVTSQILNKSSRKRYKQEPSTPHTLKQAKFQNVSYGVCEVSIR